VVITPTGLQPNSINAYDTGLWFFSWLLSTFR